MPTLQDVRFRGSQAARVYRGASLLWQRPDPEPVTLTPAGATTTASQTPAAPVTWEQMTNLGARTGFPGTTITGNGLVMDGAGQVTIHARAQFQGATSGQRGVRILVNSAVVAESVGPPEEGTANYRTVTSDLVTVAQGDRVTAEIYHHSGNTATRTTVPGHDATYLYTVVAGPVDPPDAPTGLTAAPAATSATLTWSAPASNGGAPITDYAVRYRPAGGAWATFADGTNPNTGATLSGLTAETTYEVQVAAVNSAGQGSWSATATFTTTAATAGTVVWQDNIASAPTGPISQAAGDAIFGPTIAGTGSSTYEHGEIVDTGDGKVLRHHLPAGELGALIVSPALPQPTLHAAVQYDIRWNSRPGGQPFEWMWGAKSGPGLVGVAPGRGIYEPTSGNGDRSIGFSGRLMWHGRGYDGTRPYEGANGSKLGPIAVGEEPEIVTYVYAISPDGANFGYYGYHEVLPTKADAFKPVEDTWYTIRLEVKLNTIGQADGWFIVTANGATLIDRRTWTWRSDPAVTIQAVLYDIHRGGGASDGWISQNDNALDVRNVTVTDLA